MPGFDPFAAAGLAQGADGNWSLPSQAAPATAATPPAAAATAPATGAAPPAGAPVGVVPVIDVGTTPASAVPGEAGSGFRPVVTGPKTQAGKAMPAAPVVAGPTGLDALNAAGPGAAAVPPPAATPDAAGASAAAPPAGAAEDPFAAAGLVQHPDGAWGLPNVGAAATPAGQPPAAIPPEVAGQSAKNQPWYGPMANTVLGALGSVEHGASMGLDEILDPLTPAIVDSLKTGKPFTQAYADAQAKQQQMRQNFEAAAPKTATALELAGSVPATVMAGPLFGEAAPGAGVVSKAVTGARNVAASAGLGGATGFTMTPGGLQDRLQGAKEGAEIGGALGAAAPLVAGTVGAASRALQPSAQVPNIVGRSISETMGGIPQPGTAPIPSVPLNLAQATGSPEAASALDVLNAQDVPGMQRARSAQNTAMTSAIGGQTAGEPSILNRALAGGTKVYEAIAGRGSTAAVRSLRTGGQIIRSEEQRLWNKPVLSEPNMSTWTTRAAVEKELRGLRQNDPDLALAFAGSPDLQRIVKGLQVFPPKAAANQLNRFSSGFRSIARNPLQPGDVRHVATRLANAVHEGMMNAPEVAGVAPATRAELEAAENEVARTPVPPATATRPITPNEVQRRDGVGHNEAVKRAAAENAAAQGAAIKEGRIRRPTSLLEFLTERGGVKPHGDLSAMGAESYHHRGGGRLVNNQGKSLDYAREAAVEAGYLPQGSDINDLLEAIRTELGGDRVFSASDQAEAHYWEQQDQAANEEASRKEIALDMARHAGREAGVTLSPSQVEHAASLLADDPNMHPEDAIRHAVRSDEEAGLQANADRLAFTGPGMTPGASTTPMPDLQTLREGVKPNPQLVAALKEARAFTKREAETLGHASFDNILSRNSRGNETATPGTAMSKFFDFANGVERPGDIRNVGRFLDDIKSSWAKLSIEERGKQFDPASIAPVKQELEDGTGNYIFGKMMDGITNHELDQSGNRMIQYRQAVDFLDRNRDMLVNTGLISGPQMDLLDRFRETAAMIQRGADLGRGVGSPTFTRLMHPMRFVDVFTGPLMGRLMGASAGALMGTFLTRWLGEAAIGAMIGSEMTGGTGMHLMQAIYSVPRQKLLEKLAEAYRDPAVAQDLAVKADQAGKTRTSLATKQWIRSLVAEAPVAAAARTFGAPAQPQQQPAMAQ